MKEDPGVITINPVNSPRLFDDAMGDGLIAMEEYGQPVKVTPSTLMGAMTPVTLPVVPAPRAPRSILTRTKPPPKRARAVQSGPISAVRNTLPDGRSKRGSAL
ncbi:trimethylamine methyltransferase family protein [Leisingera sp.]|uniref:trimethylamine methyltransferase family protein n=1 Tax=Leisingera sp. TaxID=1879318 RepID=UPI002B2657E8|nr:trimethylamine methyltransferase family protein [Leisingera sp.]